MSIVDLEFRLPDDVEAIPDPDQPEFIVSRRGSRFPPQVLSTNAWTLLERFRAPATLSGAIIGYCHDHGGDPITTLEQAFPVLVALTRSGLLVPEGSDAAQTLTPRHARGERVGPATLSTPIRVLRDSELWDADLDDDSPVVVKVVDEATSGPDSFRRETAALRRLAGGPVPELRWSESRDTGGVMVLPFIDGDPVDLAALDVDGIRTPGGALDLVLAMLDAYSAVHALGVLHGDVHPGNVLVDARGRVTLLDFGIADVADAGLGPAPRSSGGEHLDPQAAQALLNGDPMPPLDLAAEVYSLAALAYRIVTGSATLDLDRARNDALEAITTEPPRPFADTGRPPWPTVEGVLSHGLAKHPGERPASVQEFRDALAAAAVRGHVEEPDAAVPVMGAWDVDGEQWSVADPGEAADIAATLRTMAAATGDVDAHDLAMLWGVRAGISPPHTDVLTDN